jgi:hypothetical protein
MVTTMAVNNGDGAKVARRLIGCWATLRIKKFKIRRVRFSGWY